MSHVFHRSLKADLPVIVGGEGSYLIDSGGKRYLDACGGAAVSSLGHSDAAVRAAVAAQMESLAFAHSGFFTNRPAEALADFLVARAPEGTGDKARVIFLGSGSEAMEAALKLARQYHVERVDEGRTRFIARGPGYHGNTLGALSVGGHAARRKPFAPMLMPCERVDTPFAYRMQRGGESEDAFAERMAGEVEARIHDVGPETVAAFIAEPVVGASLGAVPPPKGYFRRIREICDRHGVVFIADEVMCGTGRTGTLFALEQEGVHADITTMAKGLGAGYQPIAATLASERIAEAAVQGSGTLWNGHTYMSHAVATAGALAVMHRIEQGALLANVRERGAQLAAALDARLGQHPNVGDIRGRGLFRGIELVENRDTRAPFDASQKVAPRIKAAALKAGLMCYPAQGTANGVNGDHVLLAPTYISTPQEIDRIADLLGSVIEAELGTA